MARISCFGWASAFKERNSSDIRISKKVCIPVKFGGKDWFKRRDIVKKTFESAVNSGDENVYFIDGEALTDLCKDSGTVDNCHPTDFGFASMAKALIKLFSENNI